jgi:hypothetical protein
MKLTARERNKMAYWKMQKYLSDETMSSRDGLKKKFVTSL